MPGRSPNTELRDAFTAAAAQRAARTTALGEEYQPLAHIVDEAKSWGVITNARATELVLATLAALQGAVAEVAAPQGMSNGVVEQLAWNTRRLLNLDEIGERKQS